MQRVLMFKFGGLARRLPLFCMKTPLTHPPAHIHTSSHQALGSPLFGKIFKHVFNPSLIQRHGTWVTGEFSRFYRHTRDGTRTCAHTRPQRKHPHTVVHFPPFTPDSLPYQHTNINTPTIGITFFVASGMDLLALLAAAAVFLIFPAAFTRGQTAAATAATDGQGEEAKGNGNVEVGPLVVFGKRVTGRVAPVWDTDIPLFSFTPAGCGCRTHEQRSVRQPPQGTCKYEGQGRCGRRTWAGGEGDG